MGRRLFIAHDVFSFGNTYTVNIPAGTIVGLDEAVTWSFTTATPVIPNIYVVIILLMSEITDI